MNNGDNNTTTPMALSNVQSHLTPTTSTTQLIDKVGAVSTVEVPDNITNCADSSRGEERKVGDCR